MKILFTRFPLESAFGGAEVQTLALMEGLRADGHDVTFAGSCAVLLEECGKRGIACIPLDIGAPPVTKTGVLSFAWRKNAMKEKLRALIVKKPDCIAMLSLSEKLLLTDVAANAGIKVFWIEHDTVGRWLSKNPWLSLLLKQSKKAMTIVVSELSRKIYLEMGWDEKKTVAIPNGVKEIPVAVPAHDTSALHLVCVARLSPEKGVDVLLDAMQHLNHVTLDVIGEGKDGFALKTLARSMDLGGRVRFLGRMTDVAALYPSYDALVLPSREHDPFGLVAAEAMMAGLPAIVTDACGIADYLTDKTDSIIVKANDGAALREAIQRLSDTATRQRIGEAGAKTARGLFSMQRMIDEYEKVFRM